jgi:hypothetical protein
MFILKNFEYRSEANRFDSDFVLKKTKKNELSFFLKTKGKKRKGLIANYRSFAIATWDHKDLVQQSHACVPLKATSVFYFRMA